MITIFTFIGWMVVGFGTIKLIGQVIDKQNINFWLFDKIGEYDDDTEFTALLLLIYVLCLSFLWPLVVIYWFIVYLIHRYKTRN